MKWLVLLLALTVSPFARAGDTEYKLLAGYHYFSGVDLKSLAPNTSYLVRFNASSGNSSVFGWSTGMSLISGSATANFNDAGTTRALSYTMIGGEFDVGFRIMPFANQSKLPFQPYFGVAGVIQIDSLNFGTQTVSATFPKTDAQQFFGYSLFVGTDIGIGKEWGLVLQVEEAVISGTLANATFQLGGNRVFVGLFFK